ncbi:MAG TPA: deoxyguanosinetriphosphate triphosphohydrolase [Ferrovibrio sp.]|uniref:deoxyguanosinetriphosphate triphosphohydrolase n=1 Tax=Ferrovibrio sp. TaxID=1917215 RepID=UPI002B4B80C3|nr:deoxyguanosinetriphosphate triphosphohydrolase [Ferrovibrio sp.]HLT77510.1 deoxyguanosinetriphosphate triphosphohydrolase [Ferrovibrio sp.]
MQWSRLLSAQRLGHKGAEPVTPARNPFQKDWDRVVFCSAFRRLQDKTQVHSLPESDYVRNRLTHSLEVSSVGRSLGAQVGQSVMERHGRDLTGLSAAEFGHIVAAACIGHDIGNPPFGHFGEATIQHFFRSGPGAALVAGLSERERRDFLHFEGNAQGFRVMTRLQNWRDAGGLRLTCATLATFMKYPFGSLQADPAKGKIGHFTAEAELFEEMARNVGLLRLGEGRYARHPLTYLVEAADDICYSVVDIEDGFKLGRITFREAETQLHSLLRRMPPRYREIEDETWKIAYLRAKVIGDLIDMAVEVFLDCEAQIMEGRMQGDLLQQTLAAPALAEIAVLTRTRIFETRERFQTEVMGGEILTSLLEAFCDAHLALERAGGDLKQLAPRQRALLRLMPQKPRPAASRYEWLLSVTDFISGMTDSYALKQFQRLRGLQ